MQYYIIGNKPLSKDLTADEKAINSNPALHCFQFESETMNTKVVISVLTAGSGISTSHSRDTTVRYIWLLSTRKLMAAKINKDYD